MLANPDALQVASWRLLSEALNDFGNAIQRGCKGWYWGALPSLVVGLTIRWMAGGVNHLSGRSQQAKKPIMKTLAQNNASVIALVLYLIVLIVLLAVSIILMLRKTS